MKILFLAPHPFYQNRGTPIAVDLLLEVLSAQGHSVDVLTYAEGEEKRYPGVTLIRIPRRKGLSGIRPGFSLKKLACDLQLLHLFRRRLRTHSYDLIHAVEESVFMARFAQPSARPLPYIYDMDSSLSQQMIEKHRWLGVFRPFFNRLEKAVLRRALAVIPVCRSLEEEAIRLGARTTFLLPDVSLLNDSPGTPSDLDLSLEKGFERPCFMYVGNFESYQGIDLLLDGWAQAVIQGGRGTLVLIGGKPAEIEKYSGRVRHLGLAGRVILQPQQPIGKLGGFLASADFLVSPRTQGINTPMKIYSYLDSGKPVLATRLPTHTQVLTPEIAHLIAPDPAAWGKALVEIPQDREGNRRLAEAARRYVREHHSREAFQKRARSIYDTIISGVR
jgi:glycosyltransferase involved in cell wall biosynthesis